MLIKTGNIPYGSMAKCCNTCGNLVSYQGLSELRMPGEKLGKFYSRFRCDVCGREELEYVPPHRIDIERPMAALNPTPLYYRRFGLGREVV